MTDGAEHPLWTEKYQFLIVGLLFVPENTTINVVFDYKAFSERDRFSLNHPIFSLLFSEN